MNLLLKIIINNKKMNYYSIINKFNYKNYYLKLLFKINIYNIYLYKDVLRYL
jgi:hypothetical protein